MTDLVQLEQGIRDRLIEHESLVDALLQEREQIRGSLFSRFAACGKSNCACAQGEKHGPYYVLSNRSGGEGTFIYLKEDQVGRVRELVNRHRRFRKGLKRLKGLSTRLHALFEKYESSATLAGFRQAGI
ncbi:MAG: hypothetical protein JJE39_10605 [Vicinamibacteria bacterium]|nr:hypothetical protein [Vicinamibacteria bacterium]